MMKEINVRPLLLTLLLAVSQRSSCANPIASHIDYDEIERVLAGISISTDHHMTNEDQLNITNHRKKVNLMPEIELALISFSKLNGRTGGEHTYISWPTVHDMRKGELAKISSPTDHGKMKEVHTKTSSSTIYGVTGKPPVTISCSIESDIMKGIKHLKNTFSWLQCNTLIGSHIDETIKKLKKVLSNPSNELAVNRPKIFEQLDKISDRVKIVTPMLKKLANLTISNSKIENKIDINDASAESLEYTTNYTKKFLKLANVILNSALGEFIEIKDALFNTKQMLNEMEKNKKEIQPIIIQKLMADILRYKLHTHFHIPRNVPTQRYQVFNPTYISNRHIETVTHQYEHTINIEREDELLIQINKTRDSISAYFSQVVAINDYLTDCDWITKPQNSLEEYYSNHEDMSIEDMSNEDMSIEDMSNEDMSIEDIESSLKGIKEGFIGLKNASTKFLNITIFKCHG